MGCVCAVLWLEHLINGVEQLPQECASAGSIALGKADKIVDKHIDIGKWWVALVHVGCAWPGQLLSVLQLGYGGSDLGCQWGRSGCYALKAMHSCWGTVECFLVCYAENGW